MIKNYFRSASRFAYSILPLSIKRIYHKIKFRNAKGYEDAGHIVKQNAIREYISSRGPHILVETGTYLGDMVIAQSKNFEIIYSIELDRKLWKDAAKKFKKNPNIHILQGDSGEVLRDVVPKLKEKAIFWLDGHYSGGITAKGKTDCPIHAELDAIFASKIKHIVLIDDARLFVGKGDYPSMTELRNYVRQKQPQRKITVHEDIIRII